MLIFFEISMTIENFKTHFMVLMSFLSHKHHGLHVGIIKDRRLKNDEMRSSSMLIE